MSDTPRTDALVQIIDGGGEYAHLPDLLALARQLERELAIAERIYQAIERQQEAHYPPKEDSS